MITDNFVVVSAQQLVSDFNEFRRKKLRKRDFTAERIRQETAWAVNLNCIQYSSREHEPKVAEFLATQRTEHDKAVAIIMSNK